MYTAARHAEYEGRELLADVAGDNAVTVSILLDEFIAFCRHCADFGGFIVS
jgi:hypothetical protein